LGAQVLTGLALGLLLGFVARIFSVDWLTGLLHAVGITFVVMLQIVVAPLVLTAIIVNTARLRQVISAAKLAAQTLVWFSITAMIAVFIGITIGLLTNPGANVAIEPVGVGVPQRTGSWLDFNLLHLIILGVLIGAAVLAVGKPADPFLGIARSGQAICQRITGWIIKLAPIGTAALIGRAVAEYDWHLIAPLAVFTIDVYVGCLLVLFVVYPLLAQAHGLRPSRFFAGAWPAIQFAFVSRSSVGTLPMTQRVVTRNFGVAPEYASFAVPIGATMKMDGCAAIYPALAAITVAQLFGVPLDATDYLVIAFVSVIGAAAAVGTTGAVGILTLTLSMLGLPLEGVGLLLVIDPILDMMRTATNVAGQALVPLIVAKRNGLVDLDVYNAHGDAAVDTDEPVREPALTH
jgi:Na+/H+-dicarboxylate symporter